MNLNNSQMMVEILRRMAVSINIGGQFQDQVSTWANELNKSVQDSNQMVANHLSNKVSYREL